MKKSPLASTPAPFPDRNLRFLLWCGMLMLPLLLVENVRANVYATNLRFNGGTTNVTVPVITNINLTYILNEPATAGVTIDIISGTTTLRSITLTNPSPGTLRGTNLVAWDGKDTNGVTVGAGTYTFSITAATSGSNDWYQITDDGNPGNYVWEARGIAVNKNANSPYYGRVFVANSAEGSAPGFKPGDALGILTLNADGSPADETVESGFWNSTGGWSWAGFYLSPWKLEVSDDDKLYVDDLNERGIILSFDQTASAASRRIVLNTNNYDPSPNRNLSGPFITGAGLDTQVWMADTASPGGVGIRRWAVGADGSVATNDLGTTIVQSGPGSDLNVAPFDVAVDRSNHIYTIQETQNSADPAYRIFRFPAYSGAVETNADWKIGSGDDSMQGAYGLAVDPTGRYLAVAFKGDGQPTVNYGSTRIFDASNGTSVVTITPSPSHDHTDVAWDNVGNLYTIDNADTAWRTYSPPGTNQATTLVLVTIQIGGSGTPPLLSGPAYAGGQFQFTLNGQTNESYIIQASTNLQTWDPIITNTSVNANRTINLSAPGSRSFYRAVIAP